MQNEYYKILEINEGASNEEITEAYLRLKKKYSEERFLEGEQGNNAAKMLTQVEIAYNEILASRRDEKNRNSYGSVYADVENYLKAGDLDSAQKKLDEFTVRDGDWYYYQSLIFYRKKWFTESKKQLEFALSLQPNNEKYKEAYNRMNQESKQTQDEFKPQMDNTQMGQGACEQYCNMCTTCLCLNCLCNGCCSC